MSYAVVILCGGLGKPLREETEYHPKPMVNIGPRPILWHIMKTFVHFRHTEFILTLEYEGEMIKEYFVNYEIMNNGVTIELEKGHSYYLLTFLMMNLERWLKAILFWLYSHLKNLVEVGNHYHYSNIRRLNLCESF